MPKRKAVPGGATHLSPADHVASITADSEAALAALEVERDLAKLQAFRLQTQAQIAQAEDALREKRARAQSLSVARRDLATKLAERYGVSWQTHAIEPTTGELVEVPKD